MADGYVIMEKMRTGWHFMDGLLILPRIFYIPLKQFGFIFTNVRSKKKIAALKKLSW